MATKHLPVFDQICREYSERFRQHAEEINAVAEAVKKAKTIAEAERAIESVGCASMIRAIPDDAPEM